MFLRKTICAAVLAALPLWAAAQSTSGEEDAQALADQDSIVLEDSYARADYPEVAQLRSTKEIIVIGAEQLQQKGNRTLSDALAKVPGISVGSTGLGEIDIRGQGKGQASRNIQVYADGVPITTLTNHPNHTNYDVIPIEQLDKIEVIAGGGAVLYGSGTSGGVINLTSNLRSFEDPHQSVSAEYNSEGYRVSAGLGTKIGENFAVTATASKLDRDLIFDDTWNNSEYYSLGAAWKITPQKQLILRTSYLKDDSRFVYGVSAEDLLTKGEHYVPIDATKNVGIDANGHLVQVKEPGYVFGNREQKRFSIAYNDDISDTLRWTNDLFYGDGYFTGNNFEDQAMDEKSLGYRGKVQWQYAQGSNLLVGVDLLKQQNTLSYTEFGSGDIDLDHFFATGELKVFGTQSDYHFDYEKTTAAIFVSNQIRWNDWEFVQGIRRDFTRWDIAKPLNIDGAAQLFGDQRDSWNTAIELAAAYHYRDSGRVWARYERGFTVPDGIQVSDERKVDDRRGLYATNAKDEKYDTFELGLSDKFAFSTVNLTAWMSQTDDQIDRVMWTEPGLFHRETRNLLDTQRYGIDLSMVQQFGRLTLEESYSYLHGKTKFADDAARDFVESHRGELEFASGGLEKVPEHKLNVRATYDFTNDFSAGIQYTYVGKYQNYTFTKEKSEYGLVDSYSLLDVNFSYKPENWLTIYGGVTNVLNEQYYEFAQGGPSGPTVNPGADRAFFIGVKATY